MRENAKVTVTDFDPPPKLGLPVAVGNSYSGPLPPSLSRGTLTLRKNHPKVEAMRGQTVAENRPPSSAHAPRIMSIDDPLPCDDCHFAERCRVNRWACDSLHLYSKGASAVRWRVAPHVPTRARWDIMRDEFMRRAA